MQDVNDACKNDDSEKVFDEFKFNNDNISSSELKSLKNFENLIQISVTDKMILLFAFLGTLIT